MSEQPKYLTIVFEIKDQKEFSPLQEQFRQLLLLEEDVPYRVVAMGLGNELDKLELIEEVVRDEERLIGDNEYQLRAIEEILALPHENTYALGKEVIRSWSGDY